MLIENLESIVKAWEEKADSLQRDAVTLCGDYYAENDGMSKTYRQCANDIRTAIAVEQGKQEHKN